MSCGCDVSSVGMILVAGDRFLLGIGLEPKVADFWFNQNLDPQLRRPPKNQGEPEHNWPAGRPNFNFPDAAQRDSLGNLSLSATA